VRFSKLDDAKIGRDRRSFVGQTRHLLAGYDFPTDRLYGHIKVKEGRAQFLEFILYLRTLHTPHVRIAVVLDNFSPHLSTNAHDQSLRELVNRANVA
jgi:hypothetical protein